MAAIVNPTDLSDSTSVSSLTALEVQESALKAAARHFNLGNGEASEEAKAQAVAALRTIKGLKAREKKEKEKETRVGENFQALVPQTTIQGSKNGSVLCGGALKADTPSKDDTSPVHSLLVSKPGAYADPTDDDAAILRAFRFSRQETDEPCDSDLDLEGARDMAYRKRKLAGAAASALSDLIRAKAKKAKEKAKILFEGGVLPDDDDAESSADESVSSEMDNDATAGSEADTREIQPSITPGAPACC